MRGWKNLDAAERYFLAGQDGEPINPPARTFLGNVQADPELLDELLEDRLVERLLSEDCTCRH